MNNQMAHKTNPSILTNHHTHHALDYIVGIFKLFQQYLERRRMQNINRDAFRHLLSLDESLLKDIGLTKGDVMWASQLPKSQDASVELEIVARRRGKHNVGK